MSIESLSMAFICVTIICLTLLTFRVIACGAYELTLQVVDVTFTVKEVLLLVALDLNPT